MQDDLNDLKVISAIVLMLSLAGSSIWIAHRIDVGSRKFEELSRTADDMAANLRDYAQFQTDEFRSDRNQKMVEHYFQLGEAGLLTIQKINRTLVPQLTAAGSEMTSRFRELQPFEKELTRTASNAADLIRNADDSINKQLVPRIVAIADALKDSVDDVAEVINSLNLTAQELTNLAKNPDIAVIIGQLKEASAHFNSVTGHFDEASASFAEGLTKFPDLMTSFQKYARSATRWQRFLYLAMIIRQLAAIPLRLP